MKRKTKIVSILLAVILGLSCVAIIPASAYDHSSKAPGSEFDYGDVNRDGIIDIFDSSAIQKFAVEKLTLDDEQRILGDVNDDKTVDVLDATVIQKYVVDAIDRFPADVFITEYEAEVLKLVNEERAKYGVAPLAWNKAVEEVAHLRAKELVVLFSHTRPDGRSCFSAAGECGVYYRAAAENIAFGYRTPEEVVEGWMNSEGHRENILSADYKKIGIGCVKNNGFLYWTQFFVG